MKCRVYLFFSQKFKFLLIYIIYLHSCIIDCSRCSSRLASRYIIVSAVPVSCMMTIIIILSLTSIHYKIHVSHNLRNLDRPTYFPRAEVDILKWGLLIYSSSSDRHFFSVNWKIREERRSVRYCWYYSSADFDQQYSINTPHFKLMFPLVDL